jgi:transcriptional regulator with XRE-family HTH domain
MKQPESRIQMLMKEWEKNPPETPLRWWRFICNKTQEDLEQMTGITQSLISKYERGTREPKPQDRVALAKALNISPDRLIFPTDEQNEE